MDALAAETDTKLTRAEAHDLAMLVKDRTRVLKAHAEEQAAAHRADFQAKLAAEYSWAQDEVWEAAVKKAGEVVAQAQNQINARCRELGIPAAFAPSLTLSWRERGQNLLSGRRAELQRVADRQIDAMTAAAITKIEKQALELRTQILTMAVLSKSARLFLDSLAPVEEAMPSLDFGAIQQRLEADQKKRREVMRIAYGQDRD